MTELRQRAVAVAFVIAGLLAPTVPLTAATIDCGAGPVDRSGFISASYGCSGIQGVSSRAAVAGLFGQDGWVEHGAIDIPKKRFSGGSDGGLSIAGSNLSGLWSIEQGLLDSYESVMLVLVGGKKKSPDMMAYLLEGEAGTYSSPFLKGKRGTKAMKISQFMLFLGDPNPETPILAEELGYQSQTGGDYPAVVPLPATALLLIGALGGLGLAARRRAG